MSLLHINDQPGCYPPSLYADQLGPHGPLRPSVAEDLEADLVVIGGGYTGLSTALHAAEAGLSVRVIEAHRVGFGASGRNGGQVGITQQLDQRDLERALGFEVAEALWQIALDANRLVHDLCRDDPACDWHQGIVYLSRSKADVEDSRRMAAFLAERYDYDAIDVLEARDLSELTTAKGYVGGALAREAAQINPLAFALTLARRAEAAGAVIHEGSTATGLGPGPAVTVGEHVVRAGCIVFAGNGYLGRLSPALATRVYPINNYIVATEPLPEGAVFSRRLAAADDRFVVNYWRTTADNRLIFGGGESYGDRFPSDIAAAVRPALARIFPDLAETSLTHAWGGTLAITRNRMPWIGPLGPGLFGAAGYSGHGVAMATMAGKLLAKAAVGELRALELLSAVAPAPFPGGALMRPAILRLAMAWFSLRDRIGV